MSPALPFAGKVVLVSGASGGIGRVIAVEFAKGGASLGLLARGREGLAETAAAVAAHGVPVALAACDVTDHHQVEAAVADLADALGGVDVLVNNAGGARFVSDLQSMGIEGWDKTVNLNLRAPLVLAKAALAGLSRSGGNIVTIGSVVGEQALKGLSHYATSKSALEMLTRSMAREWGPLGVRCNLVVPGLVDSGVHDHFQEDSAMKVLYEREIPLGRWATSQEIAKPVLFLASDAASYITGASLLVDGGIVA